MKSSRHVLQKTATVVAVLSFLASAACAWFLYWKVGELGIDHPINASLIAGIFFFLFVGGLLLFIGGVDLPSFSVHDD